MTVQLTRGTNDKAPGDSLTLPFPSNDPMMPLPLTDTLNTAIENLYSVFAPYLPQHLTDCCKHCTSEEDQADLQSAPLHLLEPHRLHRYNYKAMTTWGDVDDFWHFLPRMLELVAREYELDLDVLASKLEYGKWRTWPGEEQSAIERFFLALWHEVLRTAPDEPIQSATPASPRLTAYEFIEAVAHLGSIERYVESWRQEDTRPTLLHLVEFVTWEGSYLLSGLSSGHAFSLEQQQTLVLFQQPWVRERLEAAFFAPPAGYNDTEFSEAVDHLDALDRHFKRSKP